MSNPSWVGEVSEEGAFSGQAVQPGLSLLQLTAIMASYWKQSLIIAVGMTIVAAAAIKSMPKTFTAVATLMVNVENSDPLAAREFPADMLANYVTTQTELMQSPAILLPVVDRLKLTEDKEFAGGLSGGNADVVREYVEKNLSTKLEISEGRGGQLLYVSASAKEPTKAAEIANAVADVYLEEERRRLNGPAGERAQRYTTELAELRAKATAAQDKVIEFQQQHGITDLTVANADTEMQALESLEQQLLTAQNTRRSLQSQAADEGATTSEVMGSQLIQQLKGQLSTEQAQLAQDRTVLGPRHPTVLGLQSQIATTQRSLDAEIQALSANTSTQLKRATELEAKLTQAVANQRPKVLQLRELKDQGAKLVLERDSAEAVYKRALDGYDQILFAAVGNNTNVGFVSRATPPVKPTKPNKPKLLLLGVFAGLALGVAGPIAYELFLDRRVRCRDDIERAFGIPVLAEFGPMPADSVAP